MIILLSPTKQMDFSTPKHIIPNNKRDPHFIKEALFLNDCLKKYEKAELQHLMRISHSITDSTYEDIQAFSSNDVQTKEALLTYSGTVFKELDMNSLKKKHLKHAEKHVRILSGLYGILKPFQHIKPYRLEMKLALDLSEHQNLYKFWMDRILEYLNNEPSLKKHNSLILNLASKEYAKVINKNQLKNKMVTIDFKEKSLNKLKTVAMYAKAARGQMVRWILAERISDPYKLKEININGYTFDPLFSDDDTWMFTRS